MPFSVGGLEFGSNLALWGLLSLIPLIILYLIRPKPRVMTIPSLMFFMRMAGANKITSFLKQITRDWLFLIQLLTLLLLALILGEPFTYYQHDVTATNTVIVIDVSASMQLREGASTRFQKAVSRARGLLGVKNTIILAKQVPVIGLKDGTPMDAREFLNSLRPVYTPTRLGDAILLAGETLGSQEGRVIVLSDFANTGGQDPDTARSVLQTRGLVVDFLNVAEKKEVFNIGFVDADVDDDSITAYIKNFDKEERTVRMAGSSFEKTLTLPAYGVEPFSFSTEPGQSRLVLQVNDEFDADNVLFVSAPESLNVSVLLITNNRSVFLANALTAGGAVSLDVAIPPIVPEGDYDIYVIQDVVQGEILSGTFERIFDKVKDGATVIVHGQDNMQSINYHGLLAGKLIGTGDRSSVVVEQLTRFTKSLDFGAVEYFPMVEAAEDSSVILSAGGYPVLSVKPEGSGKLVFFGITETASDFKFAPDYPVFWTQFLKFLTQREDIRNLNLKTSQTMILDRPQQITTPFGERKGSQSIIVLDEAGYYSVGNQKVAVNLLDEIESSLVAEVSAGQKSEEYELHPVTEKRKYSFDTLFLLFALAFVLGEVFYVKLRGEV